MGMITFYSTPAFDTKLVQSTAITLAVLAREAAFLRPSLFLRVSALRSESGAQSHTSANSRRTTTNSRWSVKLMSCIATMGTPRLTCSGEVHWNHVRS